MRAVPLQALEQGDGAMIRAFDRGHVAPKRVEFARATVETDDRVCTCAYDVEGFRFDAARTLQAPVVLRDLLDEKQFRRVHRAIRGDQIRS